MPRITDENAHRWMLGIAGALALPVLLWLLLVPMPDGPRSAAAADIGLTPTPQGAITRGGVRNLCFNFESDSITLYWYARDAAGNVRDAGSQTFAMPAAGPAATAVAQIERAVNRGLVGSSTPFLGVTPVWGSGAP